jgi:antirestriction protein ArdC
VDVRFYFSGGIPMDIYKAVTDRILDELRNGTIPWRKTWNTGVPKSLSTGKDYRGINVIILAMSPHSSRYWLTYREAIKQGGHVRKGERATPVVYWKWRTDDEKQKQREKTGKEQVAPCVPFVSAVFNLDQVEGVERPEDDGGRRLVEPSAAERIIETMPDKPRIANSATYSPMYVPSLDEVRMPMIDQFESAQEYHGVFFHELVHSTGHEKRLNRIKAGQRFGSDDYSFEELVAEFGAAFLCSIAGIDNPKADRLHASYISGWSRVFEEDTRIILRAASAAQRAVDYIRGNSGHDSPAQHDA